MQKRSPLFSISYHLFTDMSEQYFCACCDDKVEAEHWCSDCTESLCEDCATIHCKTTLTKRHKVVRLQKVEGVSSSILRISDTCKVHERQKLTFFCKMHDQLLCAACLPESHKDCVDVITIDKASNGVKHGSALGDLEAKIKELREIIIEILRTKDANTITLNEQKELISNEIKRMRLKINTHLNRIEEELKSTLEAKHMESITKVQHGRGDLAHANKTLETWENDLENLKDSATDIHMFTVVKTLEPKYTNEENKIRDVQWDNIKLDLEFQPTDIADDIKAMLPELGKLFVRETNATGLFKLRRLRQRLQELQPPLNVPTHKFDTSRLGPGIEVKRGCFLPDNKIMLCSYNDENLLICNTDGRELRKLKMQYIPLDVAVFDDKCAVVAANERGVQPIDLTLCKREPYISVPNEKCVAVACFEKNIAVAHDIKAITIIDKEGTKLMRVVLRFFPRYLTYNHSGRLFWTNTNNHEVNCIEPEGAQRLYCSSPYINDPRGVALDGNDNLFIAGSKNVHKISKDGKAQEIILTEDDGIREPQDLSISINHYGLAHALLVINNHLRSIETFRLE